MQHVAASGLRRGRGPRFLLPHFLHMTAAEPLNRLTVTVEPWAHEFHLADGGCFELRIETRDTTESIEFKINDARATVWINCRSVTGATIGGRPCAYDCTQARAPWSVTKKSP